MVFIKNTNYKYPKFAFSHLHWIQIGVYKFDYDI